MATGHVSYIKCIPESHFRKTLQSFSGFSLNVELVHIFTPFNEEAHPGWYIIP